MKEIIENGACPAARSAIKTGQIEFRRYPTMTAPESAKSLLSDLQQFTYSPSKHLLRSFVASFDGPPASSEKDFIVYFYLLMKNLHEQNKLHYEWKTNVPSHTDDPNFAFSLLGRSYFLVYFHPHASTEHRKAPKAMVAFNDSSMFDILRESGGYARLQKKTREKMPEIPWFLADKGEANQFLQFSAPPNDPEFLGWERAVRKVILGDEFSR